VAAFDYQAVATSGKIRKGVIEADSARAARQQLREQQLTPLALTEAKRAAKTASNSSAGGLTSNFSLNLTASRKLATAELALVTRQLATLLQAALPLEEALLAIGQQSDNDNLTAIILAVRGKVLEGHTLAASLADFPRAFPHLYRATIAAGEHAGHLDKVLDRLADHTEESQAFEQQIKMAMIYPCLLLLISIVMVTGLLLYVVPDVIGVFISSGQQLPALTQGLISLSDFLASHGLWLLLALILAALGARQLLQQPKLRLRWHQQLLQLPFIKRFSRGFNTSRYASTLSILTNSGLPLVEGMKISGEVLGNLHLKKQLGLATRSVSEGDSLHNALASSGYFPPMMLHMIASGEASGELGDMLERTANQQARDLQNLVKVLVGLFEPLMLLFMGVVVLLIVLAILLPILNMNQLIG